MAPHACQHHLMHGCLKELILSLVIHGLLLIEVLVTLKSFGFILPEADGSLQISHLSVHFRLIFSRLFQQLLKNMNPFFHVTSSLLGSLLELDNNVLKLSLFLLDCKLEHFHVIVLLFGKKGVDLLAHMFNITFHLLLPLFQ